MNRTLPMLLASIVFTMGVVATRGAASGTTVTGSVGTLNESDIWQFQCTSSLTACIDIVVCDAFSASFDSWLATLDIYAPTTLIGKGATAAASSPIDNGCSQMTGVCRVPPSHGVMKAVVNVSHIAGESGSDTYRLIGTCRDTDGNDLPDSATKLTLKTNH